MARTTSSDVIGILLEDYDSENLPSLTPFIESASVIVDRVATCATARNKTLTTTELELIERWLAAHMYAMSDQPYTSRKTENAEGGFQGKTSMYLEATKYGQNAVNIDYSGCLATMGTPNAVVNKSVASAFWMGKAPSSQIDYVDRD